MRKKMHDKCLVLPYGWTIEIRNNQNLLLTACNIGEMCTEEAESVLMLNAKAIIKDAIRESRKLRLGEI